MFWHVDDEHLAIDETLGHSDEIITRGLQKLKEGKIPESEMALLRDAFTHMYAQSCCPSLIFTDIRDLLASQQPQMTYGVV